MSEKQNIKSEANFNEHFQNRLREINEIVESWPEWRRNILGSVPKSYVSMQGRVIDKKRERKVG